MNPVFSTKNLKRYQFPTHVNDLVYDRSAAKHSECFMVELNKGEAPPLHKHDDMEQVYYVIEGEGELSLGTPVKKYKVQAGDVCLVPPKTFHSVKCFSDKLKYLAIDCFESESAKLEPTWDEHVKVVCEQQGWDFSKVVK